MDERLLTTLQDLERIGYEQELLNENPADKLAITHDTGEFLSVLIKATNAKKILEISTNNGYSTIWLADAARKNNGKVVTIESDDCKTLLAKHNFAEANLSQFIHLYKGKAEDFFKESAGSTYDFIFLDTNRENYARWWIDLQECLNPGGVIVVDNAVSHLDELINFTSLVKITEGYEISIIPIGYGELLIFKDRK